jgi:hypothetical protein
VDPEEIIPLLFKRNDYLFTNKKVIMITSQVANWVKGRVIKKGNES